MAGGPQPGNELPSSPLTGTDVQGPGLTGKSNSGPGVLGQSIGLIPALGPGRPVSSTVPASDGVRGITGAGSGHPSPSSSGVWGDSDTTNGVYGSSAGFNGVEGDSWSPIHAGVAGQNHSVGPAIWGSSTGNAGEFVGNVAVSGNVTAQGNLTAKDVLLSGADCAEDFDAPETGDIQAGMVVIFDDDGRLDLSTRPYDKRVAGVISGAGSYKPGVVLDRRVSTRARIPVALAGKVYCKVDASFGAIELGDMLTTSATPGFAMKAQDPLRAFGATIGKALTGLDAGCGLIPILVIMA